MILATNYSWLSPPADHHHLPFQILCPLFPVLFCAPGRDTFRLLHPCNLDLWPMETSGYWRAGGKRMYLLSFFLCCLSSSSQSHPPSGRESSSVSAAWVAAITLSGIQAWLPPSSFQGSKGRTWKRDLPLTKPRVLNQPLSFPLSFAHTFVCSTPSWVCHHTITLWSGSSQTVWLRTRSISLLLLLRFQTPYRTLLLIA